MIPKNLIIFDLETSGLSVENGCEAIQIAARAINYWDLETHHAGEFSILIKPNRPEKAEKGALEVIGPLWEAAQKDGIDAKLAWGEFHDWILKVNDGKKSITKPIMIAHNADFDMSFSKFHMKEYNIVKQDARWGWQYPWGMAFCSMPILWSLFESCPELPNLKLNTFLDKLGMSRADANVHDAREDVQLLSQLVVRVLQFQRQAFKKMKIGGDDAPTSPEAGTKTKSGVTMKG